METISIVMLTYNNYQKFLRCMTSMFYFIGDKRIKEFIVLDNGSYQVELKNYLKELNNQIKKFRVIFSGNNLGIARGRKLLYELVQGDYIASFDSDVVIVNPELFFQVFFQALSIENMMVVGGGGGDHPFFPSLERENIDNKDSPDTPNELKRVDEVAGWFTGFKKTILKKWGGPIEMDERFTPFWGEDSDFSMQVRLAGGQQCIMGKGILGHQWSSCDKKETQTTLEDMWYKFQDKWYPKFEKELAFDMDTDFYEKWYPESKNMKRSKDFYKKLGVLRGDISSPSIVKKVFFPVLS